MQRKPILALDTEHLPEHPGYSALGLTLENRTLSTNSAEVEANATQHLTAQNFGFYGTLGEAFQDDVLLIDDSSGLHCSSTSITTSRTANAAKHRAH